MGFGAHACMFTWVLMRMRACACAQELVGLPLEPRLSVEVDVDAEGGVVRFRADRFVLGEPKFDDAFSLQLDATLRAKDVPDVAAWPVMGGLWGRRKVPSATDSASVGTAERAGEVVGLPEAMRESAYAGISNEVNAGGTNGAGGRTADGGSVSVIDAVVVEDAPAAGAPGVAAGGRPEIARPSDAGVVVQATVMEGEDVPPGATAPPDAAERPYAVGADPQTVGRAGALAASSSGISLSAAPDSWLLPAGSSLGDAASALGASELPGDAAGALGASELPGGSSEGGGSAQLIGSASTLSCKADVRIEALVPPPLSAAPAPLLGLAAGLVTKFTMQQLMPAFLDLLVVDYQRWATGRATRQEAREAVAGSLLASTERGRVSETAVAAILPGSGVQTTAGNDEGAEDGVGGSKAHATKGESGGGSVSGLDASMEAPTDDLTPDVVPSREHGAHGSSGGGSNDSVKKSDAQAEDATTVK
eukprot:184324-Chlamydomonas_euryale.AAC.9